MPEPEAAHGGSAASPLHPYDRHYFDTALGPLPYDRRQRQWLEFFGAIADRIVAEIKPRTVLDVGCAKGFLVEALRDRGVEAFGIDISEYAIGEVRADIQPYCRVASAVDPFHDRYDLIVCIEVVEHLRDQEGRRAIANMCRSAADVLFSSTPDDFEEPTHVNVRPGSWWIERFAEHGLQLDVDFDARFVAAHAMRFRTGLPERPPLDALLSHRHRLQSEVEARDLTIAGLHAHRDRLQSDFAAVQRGAQAVRNELSARRVELAALRQDAAEKERAITDLRHDLDVVQAEREDLKNRVAILQRGVDDKDALIAGLNFHLLAVQRTIGWKILERLRRVRDRLLPADTRRRDAFWRFRRLVEVLLDEGVRAFVWKTKYKIRLKWRGQALVNVPPRETADTPEARYQRWIERHRPMPRDVARMRAAIDTIASSPVISVLTPVYNTDEAWLRRAIESVRAQIYPRWELCLVNDASVAPHVRAILDEYAAGDRRIRVAHLAQNRGIAGASNHALSLATGEFVALLDHDDELAPEALFEVVKRLDDTPDLDLIYTDEDKLEPDGQRVEPFFKPEWSPDLLLSMNYITHLSVFRTSLLRDIGGFRLGFDGSQDYDVLLRFTERSPRVARIPKILYHWRKAAGSAAASFAAKPSAYKAARQAIDEALRRRGYEARVENTTPGQYSVRYRIRGAPLVSIVVPTRDRWTLLRECLRSLEERTRYRHYEIIVIDNGSREAETKQALEAVGRRWRVLDYPGPFNFSAINNLGAAHAKGDFLVFLNNDTQVIEPDWLAAMLEHAQRPEVGAVGARLQYPDGRIQHAGVVLGIGGVADHAFKGLPGNSFTYFAFGNVVRNCSAVTAACMMMSRRVFEEVEGFDERLAVALNDVDLCLRLRQRGYVIVYTPFALLHHHESGTRGRLHPTAEEELVWKIWGDVIRRGDPYYNPNLTLSRTDWRLDG